MACWGGVGWRESISLLFRTCLGQIYDLFWRMLSMHILLLLNDTLVRFIWSRVLFKSALYLLFCLFCFVLIWSRIQSLVESGVLKASVIIILLSFSSFSSDHICLTNLGSLTLDKYILTIVKSTRWLTPLS